MITRALALFFALPFLAGASKSEKVIYHIAIQGSTQLGCKITRKAINNDYMLMVCEYRCDHPLAGTIDVKVQKENIYCRGAESPSPAAIGQPVEAPQDKSTTQEEVEDQ